MMGEEAAPVWQSTVRRGAGPAIVLALAAWAAPASAEEAAAGPGADYASMSIEELAHVQISSVSKKAEPLNQAAAAVFIITREDIRRSGAASIPEMLRLAPNLEVARITARTYSITARGFGSASPNKLLVLIDGRTVYSPLHAAVFWDAQDVVPEDVDRIEVISGPGGTLWGVNAVNGVINIITRNSRDTQGALVTAGAGSAQADVAARYSGMINEDLSYRLYVRHVNRLSYANAAGASTKDGWHGTQGGFRIDWQAAADTVTVQGDFYGVGIDAASSNLDGQNVLARWTHQWNGGAESEIQVYYDRANRSVPGSIGDVVDTYDVDLRHSFNLGADHALVLGGGFRRADGVFTNTPTVFILPAARTMTWGNAFLQDTVALSRRWKLVVGAKYEHGSYTGGAFLPSARLSWSPDQDNLLWAAVSRAERAPSQFDRDYNQLIGQRPLVVSGDFQAEKLWAYELGYRAQWSKHTTISVSSFFNDYADLRSVELSPGNVLPAMFGNMMEGHTYGVEVWGTQEIAPWWHVSPGFTALWKDLRFKPGSRDVSGIKAAGNDPAQWFTLRSSMTFGPVDLDVDIREVAALPDPAVPAYAAVNMRLGWRVNEHWDFAVQGSNLTSRRHVEFGAYPARSEIDRSVYAAFRWRP